VRISVTIIEIPQDKSPMITQDPEKRAQISSQVIDILARKAPAEDRSMVLSFAPVILAESPDRILFTLPP
jgi:hypothetical protein